MFRSYFSRHPASHFYAFAFVVAMIVAHYAQPFVTA